MLYHIKLLDHFSGKHTLNLPYFFHKNLTKICKKIKSMPLSIRNTLCHYGLIKLIIMQELKSRDRTWEHFLFLEGFEISSQQSNEKGKKKKKQTTPSSTPRKRRILPPSPTVVTDPQSSIKKTKRKLKFDTGTEEPTSKGKNVLNLP